MPNIVGVTPTKNGSRNLGPSLCPGLLFPVPLHQPGALPPTWHSLSPASVRKALSLQFEQQLTHLNLVICGPREPGPGSEREP